MISIMIRNLNDRSKKRARGSGHGHSIDEDMRESLRHAIGGETSKRRNRCVGPNKEEITAALPEPIHEPPSFD
ncbi:hypothetical protein [Ruegeria sp. ANG-R]|uniref:hypothetical protein n=1 Tax=Ruegeria sp. ANG-R TaxID=1577903 RepID=UPI000A795122|nr:hypothetical protein [Ruegeria sp. ANG-R]